MILFTVYNISIEHLVSEHTQSGAAVLIKPGCKIVASITYRHL